MSGLTRKARLLVAVLFGSVIFTGCDFDIYKMPLPGGTDTGEDPMKVTVQFADVLDLVPQSTVKVNDVSVGKVTDVELDDYSAEVTIELRKDVELPKNAFAEIRQTSLLGEKFVSLKAPEEDPSQDKLADGDTITLENSGRNPEVEEVLGALSLILNNGGIEQVQSIAQEINLALEGREDSARSVLTQVDSLMGQLDANKTDIVRAIESLNRLSVGARRQIGSIDAALEELPSAVRSLDRQRDDLINMLASLDNLSDVGVRVIRASKVNTIEAVRQLEPLLTNLANAGDDLVNSFNALYAYPFVDEVVGRDPQVARNLHTGDYTNLSIELNIDLDNLPGLPGLPCAELEAIDPALFELCEGLQDNLAAPLIACVTSKTPLTDPNCTKELPEGVADTVCGVLEILLPNCTAPRATRNGAPDNSGPPDIRAPGGVPDLPEVPGLPSLPGLPGLLGTPRTSPGALDGPVVGAVPSADGGNASSSATGPTMGQLMKAYDPAMVALMVGPMAVAQ